MKKVKTLLVTQRATKLERESNVSHTLLARDYKGLPNQVFTVILENYETNK